MTKNLVQTAIAVFISLSLLISCGQEDDLTSGFENKNTPESGEIYGKGGLTLPFNDQNPYDFVGIMYGRAWEIYAADKTMFLTEQDIRSRIGLLIPSDSIDFSPQHIRQIVSAPDSALTDVMQHAGLSVQAKSTILYLINSVNNLQDESWEKMYNEIIKLESGILENRKWDEEERRIILTVTAIARHSAYYKKGRDDEDWDVSVGNLVGAVEGAMINTEQALVLSLIVSIYEDNSIPF